MRILIKCMVLDVKHIYAFIVFLKNKCCNATKKCHIMTEQQKGRKINHEENFNHI